MEDILQVLIGTTGGMLQIDMTKNKFEEALVSKGSLMRCTGTNEELFVRKEDVNYIRTKKKDEK